MVDGKNLEFELVLPCLDDNSFTYWRQSLGIIDVYREPFLPIDSFACLRMSPNAYSVTYLRKFLVNANFAYWKPHLVDYSNLDHSKSSLAYLLEHNNSIHLANHLDTSLTKYCFGFTFLFHPVSHLETRLPCGCLIRPDLATSV